MLGTVSPRAFVEKLKKENDNMHQDAHEFLNYLLNSVVEDLTHEMKAGPPEDREFDRCVVAVVPDSNKVSGSVASTSSTSNCSPHLTLVHDLFEGTLTSETRCLTCETVSSRDESFLDLSIDIERNSSVTACLRQFSASEMLCRGDKFFCDSCCGLQEAEKRYASFVIPTCRCGNLTNDAEDPDRLYELFAIIVHVGRYCQRGQWFAFDDDVVEPVQESAIPKYFGDSPAGSGYVLFYQAVNTDLQALGVKKSQVASVPSEPIIPPVVVEAPTSPVSAVPVQALEEVVAKVSPDVSESGTIATPSPSTPTLSHPSSSPAMSKPDGLPPSTAPSSTVGSGFGRQSTKPSTGSSGSVQLFDPVSSVNGNTSINGHVQHESVQKVAEPATKTGWSKGKSTSWFGWPGKKKDKEKGTPASSRKATLEDTSHLPIIDIRRPSAPALMESLSGQVPTVNGTSVLHDEPDETPGLGVDFGRTAEPPLTGSISASSSGDHLLHSVPDHRHLRTSPPRVSRSGSVSATTSGSTGSGLHVPSYSPLRPSPSPSSSASSVSTPLRHNASAPKLGVPQSITPFPLTMSPVKERKRPSTASSIPPGEPPLTIVPPVPALSPPPVVTSPIRSHTIGPVDTLQTTKVKTPKRKMSFSNAFNSFARRDKSLGKLGTHDRRASVIEGAEGLSPLVVPATPTKRK
ncbi:ubiquitin hydrolase CreB [Rhizoctonia solani AG-1 IA]|uniref:ubiquitinyl hydrolase 1 n=1 Tax=Thanatephorus cucumeris (strain AG1-IA) TaxID=983506 RepID=L8WT46_THACA|nr:ubiquitin hydrolase CreB [Rhizoctonia solani AG-1 IA]